MSRPRATLDAAQLLDTQRAFDSVAADYDGPRGNNELIQRMRCALWDAVGSELPAGARLLDLGCGTGIDAVEFARRGHAVVATDWSPQMVERSRARVAGTGLASRVTVAHLGIHQLDRLDDAFDGIYSNFGPLNCVADLRAVAADCARLLKPGGRLVFSVMGRICPWELAHYALRGYRALSLFMPPPYLVDYYRRHRTWCERLGRLDDRFGTLPLLRDMGDHFLIAMRRR
jgi:SAM-dependent methyltransferase